MGYLSRLPNSNKAPKKPSNNPWGSQNPCLDDIAVLLNELGKRCHTCKRVVLNKYVKEKNRVNYCPEHEPK